MLPTHRLPAWALAACLAGAAAAQPWPAAAQGTARPALAPAIDGLEVNADAGFLPGSTLDFTVRGTPGGQMRVQVPGSPIDLALKESSPGRYTGSYTVRRTDQLDAQALIRAQLSARGTTARSEFRFPSSFAARLPADTAVASAPAGPVVTPLPSVTGPVNVQAPPPPAAQVRIDRFDAKPVARLAPGERLEFVVEGVPGATVTVDWPGLQGSLLLREERPGRYVGTYTLRPQDTVQPGPAVATLASGGRRVTAQLATPLVATTAPPVTPGTTMGAAAPTMLPLQVTSPLPNATVNGDNMVLQGRTAPGAMVHVRVDAVPPTPPGRVAVAQPVVVQTVQADANGQFTVPFGPRRAAPGTRYDVQLHATHGAQATPEQRMVLFQQPG